MGVTKKTYSKTNSSLASHSPDFMDYIMGTGAAASGSVIVTCSGNFYDSGGQNVDYGINEDLSLTFTAAENQIILDFTSFDIENNATCSWDYLRIYDGASTGGTLIGEYCGTNSPGKVTSTMGSLHIVFHSDNVVPAPGWEATVSCSQIVNDPNLMCNSGSNQINGTVFEDFDFDGIYSVGEDYLGVAGVNVQATDSLNNNFNTTTGDDGTYSFNGLVANRTYRVEFSIPTTLDWATTTFFNGDNGSKVQFIKPGNCANLGMASPIDYCENKNPPVLISCFETGNAFYGTTGNENKSIVEFPYSSSGPTATGISEVTQIYETGSVWGLAWQAATQRLFSATILKRHSGLGPEGMGGIYVAQFAENGNSTTLASFDLEGVSPANGGTNISFGSVTRTGSDDYTLPNSNNTDSRDIDAFDKAGKVGYGDIDISPDGKTLWTVNLNQRALISIDVSDPTNYPGTVNQYLINNLAGLPSCTNGVLRPWGLGFYRGRGYLGCICSAENGGTIGDAEAFVLSFDPQNPTAFTTELNFDLDYSRELAVRFTNANSDGEWQPWVSTWAQTGLSSNSTIEISYPQPIVSDIGFADDGDMIIGMADRFGFQMGFENYYPISGNTTQVSGDGAGDILKACLINGNWVLEGGAGCADNDTNSSELDDGPSGTGEFFYRDDFDDTTIGPVYNHNETFVGSIDVLKGTNEILATHYDPINGNYSFDLGVLWHNPTTGARTDEFRIIDSGPVASKGNNLGDVVAACAPAPIQIGNYVWLDENGDGIQDAGEQALEGIRVELYDENGTLLAFDTTTSMGQYYFANSSVWKNTWLTANDTLQPNTNYYIVVGNGQFNTTDFSISIAGKDYELTIDSINSGMNRYEIDSDGTISNTSPNNSFNNLPATLITTGEIGEVDHSFDFGFKKIEYDYGDLPDAASGTTGINDYETLGANGGPSHRIKDGLLLGDLIDAEDDGVPSATASGDDVSDGSDDEDGVVFLNSMNLTPGGTIRLPFSAINTTGDTAYVVGWIDWDGDGDFDGSNEMVVDTKDNKLGDFPDFLEITIPDTPLNNSLLGFRLRLSNSNNLTPYNQVNSGEVEDYLIELDCAVGICSPAEIVLIKE